MHVPSASVGLWLGCIKDPKLLTICLTCAATKPVFSVLTSQRVSGDQWETGRQSASYATVDHGLSNETSFGCLTACRQVHTLHIDIPQLALYRDDLKAYIDTGSWTNLDHLWLVFQGPQGELARGLSIYALKTISRHLKKLNTVHLSLDRTSLGSDTDAMRAREPSIMCEFWFSTGSLGNGTIRFSRLSSLSRRTLTICFRDCKR